jgi:primosomal protein N' (replication factor Y)
MSTRYFDLVFDIPANQYFTYRVDEKGAAAVGKRAMAPFGKGGRDSLGFIVAERAAPPENLSETAIKPIRRVVDDEILFDERDIALAEWIAAYYLCGAGQAVAAMLPSGRRMVSPASFFDDSGDIAAEPLELSAEQQKALDAIIGDGDSPLTANHYQLLYLYGITGSGKTEVFLRAAEYMLKAGK